MKILTHLPLSVIPVIKLHAFMTYLQKTSQSNSPQLRLLLLGVNLICQTKLEGAKRVLEALSDINENELMVWIVLGTFIIGKNIRITGLFYEIADDAWNTNRAFETYTLKKRAAGSGEYEPLQDLIELTELLLDVHAYSVIRLKFYYRLSL